MLSKGMLCPTDQYGERILHTISYSNLHTTKHTTLIQNSNALKFFISFQVNNDNNYTLSTSHIMAADGEPLPHSVLTTCCSPPNFPALSAHAIRPAVAIHHLHHIAGEHHCSWPHCSQTEYLQTKYLLVNTRKLLLTSTGSECTCLVFNQLNTPRNSRIAVGAASVGIINSGVIVRMCVNGRVLMFVIHLPTGEESGYIRNTHTHRTLNNGPVNVKLWDVLA